MFETKDFAFTQELTKVFQLLETTIPFCSSSRGNFPSAPPRPEDWVPFWNPSSARRANVCSRRVSFDRFKSRVRDFHSSLSSKLQAALSKYLKNQVLLRNKGARFAACVWLPLSRSCMWPPALDSHPSNGVLFQSRMLPVFYRIFWDNQFGPYRAQDDFLSLHN